MNIAVGLIHDQDVIAIRLKGNYLDPNGKSYLPGYYQLTEPITLEPSNPETDSFIVEDFRIGVGFHWEQRRKNSFRGRLRVVGGEVLTAINDIDLESYVESVISSEMNPDSPRELLNSHAVISRSWIIAQLKGTLGQGSFSKTDQIGPNEWVVERWYGTESHSQFDVCADDHCQRYQGLGNVLADRVRSAVETTRGQVLVHRRKVCDARFSKCCGGVTENYSTAWFDNEVPYLKSVVDAQNKPQRAGAEGWICSNPSVYCNSKKPTLLEQVLPDFDLKTEDFFRWQVHYGRDELSELIHSNSGLDIGTVTSLHPIERGPSGRIIRLRITGSQGTLTVGKELEIRRVLSSTHLFSSAFVVFESGEDFNLRGAGWGHGVGLCQIGAAVMASNGIVYKDILRHYYPEATVEPLL